MIYHLTGHATVDTDILTSDKTCLVRTKEKRHVGNVHRIAHTSCRLLNGMWAFIDGLGRIYLAWRNRIDTNLSCQTHSQRMSQGGDTTFCSRIALSLRLAHAVTR